MHNIFLPPPLTGRLNNNIRGSTLAGGCLGRQSLTFLCDADGAAAHPHSQRVHTCIDQVLSLSRSHHCRRREEERPLELDNDNLSMRASPRHYNLVHFH